MLHTLHIPLIGRHHSGIDDARNITSIMVLALSARHIHSNTNCRFVSSAMAGGFNTRGSRVRLLPTNSRLGLLVRSATDVALAGMNHQAANCGRYFRGWRFSSISNLRERK
jgi:hypothetical protein